MKDSFQKEVLYDELHYYIISLYIYKFYLETLYDFPNSENTFLKNIFRGEGVSGEKGEGFVGTIIKDTWTIMGWGGNGREVERVGGLGWGGEKRQKTRKLCLNNNHKKTFSLIA